AYGGADMKVEGTITNAGRVDKPTRHYLKFDVMARVTISDNYTFAPEGLLGSRLWIKEYEAANFLQRLEGGIKYKPFSNTVALENTYTGLRSDQIMGFAFHTQRPFRQGEPLPRAYEEP